MIKQALQDKLYERVKWIMDSLIDGGYATNEIFDELCNQIDPWCKGLGYTAYIRVFWYDETDPDEMLDDVADIWNRYDIDAYCNIPSCELDACFTVMLYKQIRDDDEK